MYDMKELFSEDDWMTQWFELGWKWSQWWFQSENIQLFESMSLLNNELKLLAYNF